MAALSHLSRPFYTRYPATVLCIGVDCEAAAVFYATRDSPFLILYYIVVLNAGAFLFLQTVNIIFDVVPFHARAIRPFLYGIVSETVCSTTLHPPVLHPERNTLGTGYYGARFRFPSGV